MNRTVFQRPQVRRHLLVWALILSLFGFQSWYFPPGVFQVFGLSYSWLLLLAPALAIYVHYWLLTTLFEHRRYLRYLLATAAATLLSAALLMGTDYLLHPAPTPGRSALRHHSAAYQLGHAAANIATMLLLATVARYTRRGIASYYQVPKLRALQLETELNLLKAQVNQHFLFNTLNNL